MIEPSLAHGLLRFAIDATALLLWGTSSYLAALVPAPLAGMLAARLVKVLRGCGVILALASAALLPVLGAELGEGWGSALDGSVLHGLLTGTEVGKAALAGLAASLFACLGIILPRGELRLPLVAGLSGLALASLTLAGHAAAKEGSDRLMQQAIDLTHMLSAGAWAGALLPVALILPLLDNPVWSADARQALMRFSSAGHFAVALTLLTGAANTGLVLGQLPIDWTTPYQRLLSAKILLALLMVLLALANRYIFVPRLHRQGRRALRALRRGTLAEIALSLLVLGLVAWFGMLDPLG